MFVLAAAITFAQPAFTGARPWALGFSPRPRIALVADLTGSGISELVSVDPKGDSGIDVLPTVEQAKAGSGFRAIDHWGKDCQAAAVCRPTGAADSIVGIFNGADLRLAGSLTGSKLSDTPAWVSLPHPLDAPALASLDEGKRVLAFSTRSGNAYSIDVATRQITRTGVPGGIAWVGDCGDRIAAQTNSGQVEFLEPHTFRKTQDVGVEPRDWRPAAGPGILVFGGQVWTPGGLVRLSPDSLPPVATDYGIGKLGADGPTAVFQFRNGKELHTANLIQVRLDSANPKTADLQDSSNDGLLDGWKRNGFRGLDLKGMGCTPGHADVVCLVSRFDDVTEDRVKSEMKRVIQFYADLKLNNPDGTTGIRFHPIYLAPVTGPDKNNPWWTNRDKFRPEKWRGVVHWMQITRGGGGQADELSDGGTCGENALWAVFVHEFGHQLSLNHEGFWPNGSSPIYTSLMNYNYSYSFEDSRDKIHYSDGSLGKIVLREDDLDETLPYPYEKVKFLEQAPYHFRLKRNGTTTLIDWNWNGIFGEKHVKADVNYAYSTTAGERDNVGKAKTAPCLFTYRNRLYAVFGADSRPNEQKVDPTIRPDRPGRLILKRFKKRGDWDSWTVDSGGLIGDPVAAEFDGKIQIVYPTEEGIVLRSISDEGKALGMSSLVSVSNDSSLTPSVGVYHGRLYIILWPGPDKDLTYRILSAGGTLGPELTLRVKSSNPVGLTTDTVTGNAVLGLAQDLDKGRTNRWQIRNMVADEEGKLSLVGDPDWVEGVNGGSRGTGRITLLFEQTRDSGPKGRIYFFCKGMTGKDSPWACGYVAMQIADKSVKGGWLVRRYYDEWSQTRSAVSATWFNHEIAYAYRWVDGGQGETDNNLHVGYQGSGIQKEPMGDHDDLTLIRNFGLANSILTLGSG